MKKEVLYIEGVKYQANSDRDATPITPEVGVGAIDSLSRLPPAGEVDESMYKTGRETSKAEFL